jgi:Leucine-rich repeat (LRR) protein
LEELTIYRSTLPPGSLIQFAQHALLARVTFQRTNLSAQDIRDLKNVKGLRSFAYTNAKCSSAMWKAITGLTNITKLNLSDTKIGFPPTGIKALANLRSLDLSNADIADDSLEYLAPLSKLEYLNLSRNPISDVRLNSLRKMTHLHWLALNDTNVSERGLCNLSPMPQLKSLVVINNAKLVDKQSIKRCFPGTKIVTF